MNIPQDQAEKAGDAATSPTLQEQPPAPKAPVAAHTDKTLKGSLATLKVLDKDLLDAFERRIDEEARSRAIDAGFQSSSVAFPNVYPNEKVVVVGSDFVRDSDFAFLTIAYLSKKLSFDIRIFEHQADKDRNLSKTEESFCLGIMAMARDPGKAIKTSITKDTTPYQQGKIAFRSVQLCSYAGQFNCQAFMRKNNMLFSNNEDETELLGKKKIKVEPIRNEFNELFRSSKWSKEYVSILERLIKLLGNGLEDPVRVELISPYIMPKGDYIKTYFSFRVPSSSKKKGRKEELLKRVPVRPKPSSLLMPAEREYINSLTDELFKDPIRGSHEDWINAVLQEDNDVDAVIFSLMEKRKEFLEKFGSLTTKRLKEVRKATDNPKLRKADVSQTMLTSALSRRRNYPDSISNEILGLITDEAEDLYKTFLSLHKDVRFSEQTSSKKASIIYESLRVRDVFAPEAIKEIVEEANKRNRPVYSEEKSEDWGSPNPLAPLGIEESQDDHEYDSSEDVDEGSKPKISFDLDTKDYIAPEPKVIVSTLKFLIPSVRDLCACKGQSDFESALSELIKKQITPGTDLRRLGIPTQVLEEIITDILDIIKTNVKESKNKADTLEAFKAMKRPLDTGTVVEKLIKQLTKVFQNPNCCESKDKRQATLTNIVNVILKKITPAV
jgi:hypothetical protein